MMLRQANLLKTGDVVKLRHDRYPKGEFVIMKEAKVAGFDIPGYIAYDAHPVGSEEFTPSLVFHPTDLVEIIHQ